MALSLAPPGTARAQPAAPDPDPWWGPDKALHLSASAVIAAGGYAGGAVLWDDYAGALALGGGLALGAGFAKETLDLAGLGHPSWKDITWDVLGTLVGLGISLSIHAVVRAASASPPAASAEHAR